MIRENISIDLGDVVLDGTLIIPDDAIGLVLFSHGSGSSRFSPRNNFVAEQLQKQKVATLLFDLLTKHEDAIYENRFDIDLLTARLLGVTKWAVDQQALKRLPKGYFGASTGAASAMTAATKSGNKISAIVSRGGRPDLAIPTINEVKAPTLLIVGGNDRQVLNLNKQAYKQLKCIKELQVVEGASHLFEEERKLEEVARLATDWFLKYFDTNSMKAMSKPGVKNASEH